MMRHQEKKKITKKRERRERETKKKKKREWRGDGVGERNTNRHLWISVAMDTE